jgi:hypothetical protein
MIRNYFSGTIGGQTNTLLTASAYNMKKWIRLKATRDTELNFTLVFQGTYFGSGKYPMLMNE